MVDDLAERLGVTRRHAYRLISVYRTARLTSAGPTSRGLPLGEATLAPHEFIEILAFHGIAHQFSLPTLITVGGLSAVLIPTAQALAYAVDLGIISPAEAETAHTSTVAAHLPPRATLADEFADIRERLGVIALNVNRTYQIVSTTQATTGPSDPLSKQVR